MTGSVSRLILSRQEVALGADDVGAALFGVTHVDPERGRSEIDSVGLDTVGLVMTGSVSCLILRPNCSARVSRQVVLDTDDVGAALFGVTQVEVTRGR